MNISIGDKVTFNNNSGRMRFGIVLQILFETNQYVVVETEEDWSCPHPKRFVWTLREGALTVVQDSNDDTAEKAYKRAMRGL